MKTKNIISAFPRLQPTQIINTRSGEILDWDQYVQTALNPLLTWVKTETQRLYDQNPIRVHELALELKGSANSYARRNGYKAEHLLLPRHVKAKSRLAELCYHKLMSETAAYEKHPNPHKQMFRFNETINLGAADSQMSTLEREQDTLILTWACWNEQYELHFRIPLYLQERSLTKISLPVVSAQGFIFTGQETPPPITGKRVAGVDLGRVKLFTMAVLNENQTTRSMHTASRQLEASNRKRERLLKEAKHLHRKISTRKQYSGDTTILTQNLRLVRGKAARLGASITQQAGAQIAQVVTREQVSLLRVENLKWVTGARYGGRWNHGAARAAITHATRRAGGMIQEVNPAGTSQACHACGAQVVHNARSRVARCEVCQISLDRDFNAALNIAKRSKFYPVMFNRRDGRTSSNLQCSGHPPTVVSCALC